MIQTLKLINSYLYRRSICNIPSNALNKVFAAMTKHVSKLKKEKEYSHIESVIEYLMTRKNRGIFPRDAEFKKSFIELDIYNRRDLALFTLYTIEESIHRETVEMNDLTIEHIMPQVLTPKWSIDLGKEADEIHKMYKDTIGNLTLTKYNEEISNKSFEEKKIYYTESNIKITRDIAEYDKWDRESIIQRANELFEIAKEIWKVPEDKYSDLSPEELQPGQEYSIMDSLKVTGYKPNSLIIDNETIPVSSWKELLKKTCIYLIELDTELFYSLLNNNNFKKLISKNKADLRRPEALTNDIYLEVNLSAKDILNYIKLLTKEYEIEEDIYFTIRY